MAENPDLSPALRATVDTILGHRNPYERIESIWKNAGTFEEWRDHLGTEPTMEAVRDYIGHLDDALSHPIQ